MQPQPHIKPQAGTYFMWVNDDTVLLQTTTTRGDLVELALSLDQARHLVGRLWEAIELAPQVGAAN